MRRVLCFCLGKLIVMESFFYVNEVVGVFWFFEREEFYMY